MTTEELLAIPEDGIDRWLIRGELREKPDVLADRWHAAALARLGSLLSEWLDEQPRPRGELLAGHVGCRLERDPDTTVAVDLVYLAPELAAIPSDHTDLVPVPPTLAIEVLGVEETFQEMQSKVQLYLAVGIPLAWVVDPHCHTLTVYQSAQEPRIYNADAELPAGPNLPGLRLRVESIFSRD